MNNILSSKTDIIFDFDGTICDIVMDWTHWHMGVGSIFQSFDQNFDLHLKGQYVHTYQNDFFKKYGKKLQEKVTAFSTHYEEKNVTGFDINRKALDFIKNTTQNLYIWSSNSTPTILKFLEQHNIKHKFKKIISRQDTFFIKPDPEGFLNIFDNTTKDKYFFIGDSSFDRDAAKSADIDFLDIKDLT